MQRNKLLKIVIVTESIFIFILLILLCFSDSTNNKETLLLNSTSEDGTAFVAIYEKNEPFLFGDSTIEIYYRGSKEAIPTKFTTSISNDGAALNSSNYILAWEGSTAKIILRGSEQEDVIYRISNN